MSCNRLSLNTFLLAECLHCKCKKHKKSNENETDHCPATRCAEHCSEHKTNLSSVLQCVVAEHVSFNILRLEGHSTVLQHDVAEHVPLEHCA